MYELNKVGERTYYINAPTNMGIFKINDTDVCLIDSGPDRESGRRALKIIEANGWRLSIIINTHSHADHIGGNRYLQSRTGCKIYTPDEEVCFTKYTNLEPVYLSGGYPYKEIRTKFFLADPSDAEQLTAEVLPQGLETLRLDGHSFAMVAIRTSDDVWFLADALVSEKILGKFRFSHLYDVEAYLQSLKKVGGLGGRLFIPSHAEPVSDIAPLAAANAQNVREVIETVKELCISRRTTEDIVKGIFDRYSLKIDYIRHTLVTCTMRSYISYLYDKGIITAEFSDNKLFWKANNQ